MKPITPDNYKEFKPSEFVRSFCSDIDVAIKMGKPMDMKMYETGKRCLPCLGGLACMNMGIRYYTDEVGSFVSELGNEIRIGGAGMVKETLENLHDALPI